ncbi:Gamma-aminobutyric acid (GABA) B receptor [Seminavis robusta]|uniref:Gamma-aminobutyric acid (GABA) B receptor n=1 Tax=Seminavis robusta TaxID=568900 RepID=A0A9N8EAL9_9STRA|nr:Gamma-aminobutyric acid (GABA) B receptor [Seminavis robusta]|eukprot:Sro847_g210330.1 Gamma-aminobutyric acid (GABA) B receptor (1040) ;mRNA; r:31782-35105
MRGGGDETLFSPLGLRGCARIPMVLHVLWVFLLSESTLTGALVPSNGACALNVLLPFSVNLDRTGVMPPVSTGIFTRSLQYSMGYNHLAAALMAMEDFNARNGRITPELETLTDCPVHFNINGTMFLDTGVMGHLGNRLVVGLSRLGFANPCALAGPYFDLPAQNIATIAAAAQVPHIPSRGYNVRLALATTAPMTTNISPDIIGIAQAGVSLLKRIKRDNYIAYMHPITDFGVQAAQSFGVILNNYNIEHWELFGYLSPFFSDEDLERSISDQMERVRKRGFRTILISLDAYILELPEIADAAAELGMLNGDYVWILLPSLETQAIHNLIRFSERLTNLPSYENVVKFLRGATLILEVEGFHYLGNEDPFLRAWKNQTADFVDRVNQAYTLNTLQAIEKDPLIGSAYFQTYGPESGAARLYDAIQAIGLGACKARKQSETDSVNSTLHLDAIRKLDFTGASGHVKFGDPANKKAQVRYPATNVYGIYNLYPPSGDATIPDPDKYSSFEEAFVLTEIVTGLMGPYETYEGNWTKVGPALRYASGRTEPPHLLRDVPEQNYLPQQLRIVGFTLMSICLFACAVSLAFVAVNRSHRIVRASQPGFLCLVLIGAATSSLAICTVSWDESYGWDEAALSSACVATPWLFCMGHIITYGALGCKLWRVNKVLQFTRRKINASAVIGPMVALLCATIVVLAAWTIHDPLAWQRDEVDKYSGESIGQCDSDSMWIYVPLLMIVMSIPTLLTCVMAWKTKDVDETFTESSWIFILIVVQIQVIMVSIPLVVILRGISTEGRYMGLILLIWTFPASTVTFIMYPKYQAYYNDTIAVNTRNSGVKSSTRGASQGVQISGISGVSNVSKVSSELESAFLGDRSSKGERDRMVRFSGVSEASADVADARFGRTSIMEETSADFEEECVSEKHDNDVNAKAAVATEGDCANDSSCNGDSPAEQLPEKDIVECAPQEAGIRKEKQPRVAVETTDELDSSREPATQEHDVSARVDEGFSDENDDSVDCSNMKADAIEEDTAEDADLADPTRDAM